MLSKAPIRFKALEVIKRVLKGEDLQFVLDEALGKVEDRRDKGLLTELVYGYFRYKSQLEFIWKHFLQKKTKLPLELDLILSLGAYQLIYLDRVPAYAVISWSVEFIKQRFSQRLAGLVNAILRKISKLKLDDDFFKQKGLSRVDFLSYRYACPSWLVKYLLKNFTEEETLNYLTNSLQRPDTGFLLCSDFKNLAELDKEIKDKTKVGFSVYPGVEEKVQSFLKQNEIKYYLQSLESQRVLLKLLSFDNKNWIIDACAGSGGKSFILKRLGFRVLASDINLKRLKFLQKQNRELDLKLEGIIRANAYSLPIKKVDNILLDVPCSGLGVINRKPDLKWKRKEKDIWDLTGIQKRILQEAAKKVKVGGRIYYLTCTLAKEENEKQIEAFLINNKEFKLEKKIAVDFAKKEIFFGARLYKYE